MPRRSAARRYRPGGRGSLHDAANDRSAGISGNDAAAHVIERRLERAHAPGVASEWSRIASTRTSIPWETGARRTPAREHARHQERRCARVERRVLPGGTFLAGAPLLTGAAVPHSGGRCTGRHRDDDGETFGTFAGQLVLIGVCVVVASALWGMVVLSRPAHAERLLRVARREVTA